MPTPKKKLSRMRRGHRRSHNALHSPSINRCPNCNSLIRPHHICPSCGYYKGKEILAQKE